MWSGLIGRAGRVTEQRLHPVWGESVRATARTEQVGQVEAVVETQQHRCGAHVFGWLRPAGQEPPPVSAAGSILLVWYSRFPAASGYTDTVTS